MSEKTDETRQKIIESARKEFVEKGFEKASLRNICKDAGVTTGALYFFFQDKDDLFSQIFLPIMNRINDMIDFHFASEITMAAQGELLNDDVYEELELATDLVNEIYKHREDLMMLLNKASGSSLESLKDELISKIENHNRIMADNFAKVIGQPPLEENLLHWISHNHFQMFAYMIEHIENINEAHQYLQGAMRFSVGGWLSLFGVYSANRRI